MEVVRKDGIILLREMAAEVKNFMDFKMNAVMVSTDYTHSLLYYCTDNIATRVLILRFLNKQSRPRQSQFPETIACNSFIFAAHTNSPSLRRHHVNGHPLYHVLTHTLYSGCWGIRCQGQVKSIIPELQLMNPSHCWLQRRSLHLI